MRLNISRAVLGLSAIAVSAYAGAAPISYNLMESNVLPDGSPYLSVMITENAETEGMFDFTVTPGSGLTLTGDNSGIQAFGLNVEAAMTTEENGNGSISVMTNPLVFSNLPEGWTLDTQKNMSEFGRYDIRLHTTGNNRTDELMFSVEGTREDLIGDQFAAHVVFGDDESGFFGGAVQVDDMNGGGDDPSAVPLPPAAWLLVSGVMGMVTLARRRHGVQHQPIVQ